MIRLIPDETAAAVVKYDPDVQVIDVSARRSAGGSPTSVWVVYGLFMDYESDGRVVHMETMVPNSIMELTPLRAPSPVPGLYALFVDTPEAAPEETFVYDQCQKLVRIQFGAAGSDTRCYRLGERLLIETEEGRLVALWFTDLKLVLQAPAAS